MLCNRLRYFSSYSRPSARLKPEPEETWRRTMQLTGPDLGEAPSQPERSGNEEPPEPAGLRGRSRLPGGGRRRGATAPSAGSVAAAPPPAAAGGDGEGSAGSSPQQTQTRRRSHLSRFCGESSGTRIRRLQPSSCCFVFVFLKC